ADVAAAGSGPNGARPAGLSGLSNRSFDPLRWPTSVVDLADSGGRPDLVHRCAIALSIPPAGRHRPGLRAGPRMQSSRARPRAALLRVKAPMAGHGKSFDRTSMPRWFHARASRHTDTVGRAI